MKKTTSLMMKLMVILDEEKVYCCISNKYCKNKCCNKGKGFQLPSSTKAKVLCGDMKESKYYGRKTKGS